MSQYCWNLCMKRGREEMHPIVTSATNMNGCSLWDFTAANVSMAVFLVVASWGLVSTFRRNKCPTSLGLKMEAICFTEMSVPYHVQARTAWELRDHRHGMSLIFAKILTQLFSSYSIFFHSYRFCKMPSHCCFRVDLSLHLPALLMSTKYYCIY